MDDSAAAMSARNPYRANGEATAPPRTALPAGRDLLYPSIRRGAVDHPLVRWACQLAGMHSARVSAGVAGSFPTGDVVHAIDVWIELNVPQHRRGLALHTETLGTVIDHIAAAQAQVAAALSDPGGPDSVRVHIAWHRLAELVDSYDDLVREVICGKRRLPAPAGDG
ncbi:DUF4254 domain-containing protein [Nocardia brasiliensis]|uniref:DUF4254 domain-containing protein n=1 Tax=Nocardia brasiliensis TaxID=37326 RepID=UPI00245637E5|nr:DUF4254 domain-containing protein [Nocardia brasiliensis]